MLVKSLEKLVKDREWRRASTATIRNDVVCFVRTYVSQLSSGKASHEDSLDSPLTELGLIRPIGKRHEFRFRSRAQAFARDPAYFCYAVTQFWSGYSTAQTLSFEALAHEPGIAGQGFSAGRERLDGPPFYS